jgi:acetyl-CoA carboxylase carboxyl transferase subunit beta
MTWFKRQKAGILTRPSERNEAPDGLWQKCPGCGEITSRLALQENLLVCPKCDFHMQMDSVGYFRILFDDGEFELHDQNLSPVDSLQFQDRKPYVSRLEDAQVATSMRDAARAATGLVGGHRISVACMDFAFIGGSMGSVVGEIIARAIRRACEERIPLLIISQSGGARMMEGALSLMQMAKTSANLAMLGERGQPYISLMTHPTTGGVTASYAMLGDFNFAEPGALIGFAGPRVIRETIGQDLPEGFQRAEFLIKKGFIDRIVHRTMLRQSLSDLLGLLTEGSSAAGR